MLGLDKKYISGILTGFAGTMMLVIIFGSVYLLGNQDILKAIASVRNQKGILSEELAETGSGGASMGEIVAKVSMLEKYIDAYYMDEVDKSKYADGIYKGVLASLGDPYAAYYTQEEYQSVMESSDGAYCGIGATVSQDMKTGIITILQPFPESPAAEAGILPGDVIYKVEGKEVTGEDLTAVVSRMKGQEGTKVVMELVREGVSEPIEVEVSRRMVEKPTISHEVLEGNIGYIVISEFDEVTAKQFRNAIDSLEKENVDGLVVDLRNNGGGRLEAVVDMLDRILPDGIIVSTRDKNGDGKEYSSTDEEQFTKPLAVLINGNSASASEVFAGAVQDYKLGTLVGTTSFGKGIVQSVIPLEDGSAIKLTTSKYYTPNGRNIHGIGIEPEVEAELPDELKKKLVIEKEEDVQLQKALDVVREKIGK